MKECDIKDLLDLYFEGQTTTEQERLLARYFSQEEIPTELMPYKAIFAAFDSARQRVSTVEPIVPVERNIFPFRGILRAAVSFSAAACIAIGLFLFTTRGDYDTGAIVCYIDGVEVTDNKVAIAEAERILGSATDDVQQAMAKVEILKKFF